MYRSKIWLRLVTGVFLFLMVGVAQASESGEMLYGAKWAKGIKQLSWGNV